MEKQLEIIKYIDLTLLPIYGIESVTDYKTIISTKLLTNKPDFLDNINEQIDNIKKYFNNRPFSFHKYDNKIKTHKQAFSYLKKCLDIAEIPYKNEYNKLRLSAKNDLLYSYYMSKLEKSSAEIRNNVNSINDVTENEDLTNEDKIIELKPLSRTDKSHMNRFLSKIKIPKENKIVKDYVFNNIVDKNIGFNVSNKPNIGVKNLIIDIDIFAGQDTYYNNLSFRKLFENEIGKLTFTINDCVKSSQSVFEVKLGENVFPLDIYIPSNIQNTFTIKYNGKMFDKKDLMLRITYDMFSVPYKEIERFFSEQDVIIRDIDEKHMSVSYNKKSYCNEYLQNKIGYFIDGIMHFNLNDPRYHIDPETVHEYKVDEYTISGFNVAIIKDKDQALMYLVKYHDEVQATECDFITNEPLTGFSYDNETVEFTFDIMRHADTYHSMYIDIGDVEYDINDVEVKLVFTGEYEEFVHDLDIEREDGMIKINNFTRENVVLRLCQYRRQSVLVKINNCRLTSMLNEVSFKRTIQYWQSQQRRKMYQTKLYDFIFEHDK